jgi:hypothetical protein
MTSHARGSAGREATTGVLKAARPGTRPGGYRPEELALRRVRRLEALKSLVVGLLLFAVVASALVASEALFFSAQAAAWLLFPLLVGVRRTLEAGSAFMLISLGVLTVAGLAQEGPAYLLP